MNGWKTLGVVASLVASLSSSAALGSIQPPASSAGPQTKPAFAPPALDARDLSTWLDGFAPYALKSSNIAGMVIVVVKDGSVLLEKGYGQADVAKATPMSAETTLIRPGSTSKLFTWTAVMQLVQQGKLDLDRNVNDYLDFKIREPFGTPVTMRDLMNHRAGFEEGLKDILTNDPKQLESTEKYLKTHPRPLLFAPGETPAYSNYGAALAGYIVERVSGEPFDQYVERHIFLPLGMANTTFEQPLPARFRANMARGYRTADGPGQPYELLATRPAGSVTTTAADMSRFMIAHLQQGRLGDYAMLSPQTESLMQRPTETGLPGFSVMAHGFFRDMHNGHLIIGHGGDTIVFHSELDLLPRDGVGIFYSFNSRGTGDAVYGVRAALFNGFMDRYFPAPASNVVVSPTLSSARQDAPRIAGRYASSRRIEHGFLSVLYLVTQTVITANPDGTIIAPGSPGSGPTKFREVAPQIWREVGGTRELALVRVHGIKTIIDSEDPVTVLQAASVWRSAPLTITILGVSLAILAWELVLWPLAPLLRRGERAPSGVPMNARRLRLVMRVAAVIDVVYLAGWYMLIQPILGSDVQVYTSQLDPVVRTLQVSGLLVIIAAAIGVWVAWRMSAVRAPWLSRIWNVMLAASFIGVVWIGVVGKLMSWNLNY
jgi:CubicO group peptidase (beta-lactamase class C family)